MNLEGFGRKQTNLIECSPVIFFEGAEENHAKPESGSQCLRKNFEPNLSQICV
jgi:hypothetical protein